jgi:methylated-DNA-protein-cysteine methyltransferase related protein
VSEPNFFERVYHVVRMIPESRVTTYGAIARYLGSGRSARMVGWALNCSHSHHLFVPAHRVVNRNGILSGKHFFGGSKVMEQLLDSEGIKIENDKVVEFKKLFWDPAIEIKH